MLLRIKQARSFSLLLTTMKRKKEVLNNVMVRCLLARSDCDPTLNEVILPAGTDPLDLPKLVLVALASLIKHLEPFGLDRVFRHQSAFVPFASRAAMTLNGNTVSNLELLNNSTDFKENGSLVSILDRCKTAMGKRQLRRWVTKPLLSKE